MLATTIITTRTTIAAMAMASTFSTFSTFSSAAIGAQAAPTAVNAPTLAAHRSIEPSDAWLNGITASHKQFFDMSTPNGGAPLIHVMNYYDTYNKTYKVKDADIDAVLTFYGSTTLYAVNDAAWAKYKLGEMLEATDPSTGKAVVRNPWRNAPVIFGMPMAPASIETLAKRGVTFILCNNALEFFANMIATKLGVAPSIVYNDLKSSILPEVQLVPGMVIAVEQAARAGLSYHKQ